MASSSSINLPPVSYPLGILPPGDHPEYRRLRRAVELGYCEGDDRSLHFLHHLSRIAGAPTDQGEKILRSIENVLYGNDPNDYYQGSDTFRIKKADREFLFPTLGFWGERDLGAYFIQVVQSLYPRMLESLKTRELRVVLYGIVLRDGFGDLAHVCRIFEIVKERFPSWDISAICPLVEAETRQSAIEKILQHRVHIPEFISVPKEGKFSETEAYRTMVERLKEADVALNISYPFPIAAIKERESTLKVYEYGCQNVSPFTAMGTAPSSLGMLTYPQVSSNLLHLKCQVLREFLLGTKSPNRRDVRDYFYRTHLIYGYIKDIKPKLSAFQFKYTAELSQKIRKTEAHLLRLKQQAAAKSRGSRRNALYTQIAVHQQRLNELKNELEWERENPEVEGVEWVKPFVLAACAACAVSRKDVDILVPFEGEYLTGIPAEFFIQNKIRKVRFYQKNDAGQLIGTARAKLPCAGKTLSLINPFPLCHADAQLLTKFSAGFAGCIGDVSLGETLSCGKLPFYAIYRFKSIFFFNFISLAQEILTEHFPGQRDFALISYFNALYGLHEEGVDLIERCQEIGDMMRNPQVYDELKVFAKALSQEHSANSMILDGVSRLAAHAQFPELKTLEEELRTAFVNGNLTCVEAYQAMKHHIEQLTS